MKYAVEMGSVAKIHIPRFIKIGSGIQRMIGEGSQTAWKSHKLTHQYVAVLIIIFAVSLVIP
jgi:hypothetical protein